MTVTLLRNLGTSFLRTINSNPSHDDAKEFLEKYIEGSVVEVDKLLGERLIKEGLAVQPSLVKAEAKTPEIKAAK